MLSQAEIDALPTILDVVERLSKMENDSLLRHRATIFPGDAFQDEGRYEHYRRAIAELAAFYNSHGYKMMILKGYACSLDWPNPEHRPCGDIDIWLYGKQKGGDALIIKEKGAKIDRSHHHHTVFYWHGFMVENHYDFIDIHHRKSSPKLEQVFKKLGQDESHSVDVYGERVFLPSPNLHALFLLRHMMEHFASEELTLRQLLDWALFVQAHRKKVDWKWLQGVLIQFGMFPAYNIFNAICVDNLGFNSELFPTVQFSPELKERVLADILSPEFTGEIPSHFFSRIIFRYKRWKANGWKHRLCFNESMASAFWSGVVGHLLKPASL